MKIKKDSLVAIGLVVLGLVVLYFGIYQGATLLFASGKELEEVREEVANWRARQDIVRALKEKIKENTFQKELEIALPERSATADLLASIEAAAFQSQVSLSDFSPASLSKNSTNVEGSGVVSYEVNLNVEGAYDNVKAFVSRLEKIKRVLRVDTVELTKTADGNINAALKLVVYYLAKSVL